MLFVRRRVVLQAGMALAVALASRSAFAQAHAAVLTDEDQATLVAVAQYLNGIKSLKGRFLQIGPDGASTAGTVWLDRPGRMRFQYDKPSPLLLVAGHGQVIFNDSQLGQTTNIPIDQTPLGLLLADTISLTGDVTTTDLERPPGQLQITLVRTKTPGDGSLTLNLEAPKLALTGWSVVDAQGRETKLRLTNVERGGSFDQSLFTFTDPDAK